MGHTKGVYIALVCQLLFPLFFRFIVPKVTDEEVWRETRRKEEGKNRVK
jgi:hypothetical protein